MRIILGFLLTFTFSLAATAGNIESSPIECPAEYVSELEEVEKEENLSKLSSYDSSSILDQKKSLFHLSYNLIDDLIYLEVVTPPPELSLV